MPSSRPTNDTATAPWRGSRLHWLAAALGTAVSAVALIVMAATAAWSAASGSASTTTRALTEAVMLLVLAAGVLALVVALGRARPLAKTPTLLWNAMLVPIGFSLVDGGARALGIATVAVAALTFLVALPLPRYEAGGADDAAL